MTARKPTPTLDIGSEVIRGLTGLRDALTSGRPLQARFTVRTVAVRLEPGVWNARDIVDLRHRLDVSQGVMAQLLATSVKTVQSWEQGHTPSPMARRLLDCIAQEPDRWTALLKPAKPEARPRRRPRPRARPAGRHILKPKR
jgi:DNA-binding transcriptional regulator YiaG